MLIIIIIICIFYSFIYLLCSMTYTYCIKNIALKFWFSVSCTKYQIFFFFFLEHCLSQLSIIKLEPIARFGLLNQKFSPSNQTDRLGSSYLLLSPDRPPKSGYLKSGQVNWAVLCSLSCVHLPEWPHPSRMSHAQCALARFHSFICSYSDFYEKKSLFLWFLKTLNVSFYYK